MPKPAVAFLALASVALVAASYPPVRYYPLSGAAESNVAHPGGGTGDPDARGRVTLAIDPANKQVCYRFALSGVSTPLMAHIHQGASLRNGPPVVTLFTGPGGNLADCVIWTHSQLAQIVADPSNFYVNIETTEYPDGALRGQISKELTERSMSGE